MRQELSILIGGGQHRHRHGHLAGDCSMYVLYIRTGTSRVQTDRRMVNELLAFCSIAAST